MMNSVRQTTCSKNSAWWKKRSTLERGLMIAVVCSILISIAFAVAFGIAASNHVCVTSECIHTASTILDYMDESVEPCENFYKFACGGFLKNTIIPDTSSKVSMFSLLAEKLTMQLRNSVEEDCKPNDPRHVKLLKTLYKTCMNITAIEARGLAPLLKYLKDLGGWPVLEGDGWNERNFDLKESISTFKAMGLSYNLLFSTTIQPDLKNSSKHIISLGSVGFRIDREYLVKGLDDEKVRAYYNFMVDTAVLLGADKERAARELKDTIEIEVKLASMSLQREKLRNISALHNPMTVRELMQRYPSILWLEYLNAKLAPEVDITENEIVNVAVPSYFSELEHLLQQIPKRTLANYNIWPVVRDSISYLTKELRRPQYAYFATHYGHFKEAPRWRECMAIASRHFSHSLGALYVRKYFNGDSKKQVSEMVSNIKQQFMKVLQTVDWMDEETKKAALNKLESMKAHIGYTDELLDDSKIDEIYKNAEIIPNNYFETSITLRRMNNDKYKTKLREPVDKTNWIRQSLPTAANAYYKATDNSIDLPAAILQRPFFNSDRPMYMNYGGIGSTIGHELTHGFDDRGSQYDKDGNLVDWWAAETKKKYLKKAECIISQYGNYTETETKLKLDGVNTQGENIADNGGLKEAYLAYYEWVRRNGAEPQLPGLNYNGRQMFWLSAAQAECVKSGPVVKKSNIIEAYHSPAEFRVIGPMSNLIEFAQDFNCPIGSPMNPVKKCVFW